MNKFELRSKYKPQGDQPVAIAELTDGIRRKLRHQTLLGVTGSGKTFTMANVVANINKPTLVISHNKTLAAQLYGEFKSFFPNNAVEFFISYYDYYQPEAYVPSTDTYIEKDSSINDEIDRLRLKATSSLHPITEAELHVPNRFFKRSGLKSVSSLRAAKIPLVFPIRRPLRDSTAWWPRASPPPGPC